MILDAETQEHKLRDLEFSFIELPKFNKTEPELPTLVEKWIFFIKNAENLNVIPASVNDKGLKSACQEADHHTWTRKELEEYKYARMRETDEIVEKMLVIEKRNIEIARSLLLTSLSNQEVAKHTDLTVEQIEQLRSENQ